MVRLRGSLVRWAAAGVRSVGIRHTILQTMLDQEGRPHLKTVAKSLKFGPVWCFLKFDEVCDHLT